jgi:phytoene desaturase
MKNTGKKVVIIGGGIGGLGAAALLSKRGYNVTLLEKNKNIGGRANIFTAEGYTFDMGPSWYLMPDIFEHFYELMEEDINDHLKLVKLGPSYKVFFPGDTEYPVVDIYSDLGKDLPTFEKFEPGVTPKIKKYLEISGKQYATAKKSFMYRNYNSIADFFKWELIKEGRHMNPLQTMERYVNKWFSDDRVKKILEYTLVFLGSEPKKTPALYNIMNFIDFHYGVYYPKGGIYTIIESLKKMNDTHGTTIMTEAGVSEIIIENKTATGVLLDNGDVIHADYVISNADLHFTETKLITEKKHQTYPEKYWDKAVMGPSAFIMYIGLDRLVPNLIHHNLRFAQNWKANFKDLFDKPALPNDPSYYVCKPTHTDTNIAPEGKDILFVLVPIAAGMDITNAMKKSYRDKVIAMMKSDLDLPDLEESIVYERSYWGDDFGRDYNAYKGTALGMAHTLKQTLLRPGNKSKKVKNLLYVGAGTNPGIGMPVCLISAELAYKRIENITHPNPLIDLNG